MFCPASGGLPASFFLSISDFFFRAKNDFISVGGCRFLFVSGVLSFVGCFWLVLVWLWLFCLLMLVSSVPIVVVSFLVDLGLVGGVGFISSGWSCCCLGGVCGWFTCWLVLLVCCVSNVVLKSASLDFSSMFLKKFRTDW